MGVGGSLIMTLVVFVVSVSYLSTQTFCDLGFVPDRCDVNQNQLTVTDG